MTEKKTNDDGESGSNPVAIRKADGTVVLRGEEGFEQACAEFVAYEPSADELKNVTVRLRSDLDLLNPDGTIKDDLTPGQMERALFLFPPGTAFYKPTPEQIERARHFLHIAQPKNYNPFGPSAEKIAEARAAFPELFPTKVYGAHEEIEGATGSDSWSNTDGYDPIKDLEKAEEHLRAIDANRAIILFAQLPNVPVTERPVAHVGIDTGNRIPTNAEFEAERDAQAESMFAQLQAKGRNVTREKLREVMENFDAAITRQMDAIELAIRPYKETHTLLRIRSGMLELPEVTKFVVVNLLVPNEDLLAVSVSLMDYPFKGEPHPLESQYKNIYITYDFAGEERDYA